MNPEQDVRSLVKEHHVFYEVSPYYIEREEAAGLPTTIKIHAGFNVDVYGIRTEDDAPETPPPGEYVLGYVALETLADKVSQQMGDRCLLEVIPLPSTVVIDGRDGKVEGMLRLRISGGSNQPAGLIEQRALQQVEQELQDIGVARRDYRLRAND